MNTTRHSIILLVLFAIAACTTPTIVQRDHVGTVTNIQHTELHGCKYRLTVEYGYKLYHVYTDSLYQPGSKFILRNK